MSPAYTYGASITHAVNYNGMTVTRYLWGTLDRAYPRPEYTLTDAAVTAQWLNEREAGYPALATPNCDHCGTPKRRQIMGTYICDGCLR